MAELNLRLLKKLGACTEAVAVYNLRQESDPVNAIDLLIDGCEELEATTLRARLDWANWLLVRLLSNKDKVRYAIFAAESVVEIFEKEHPDDQRPREAIEVAKQYLDGEITARAAADAADAAADAADAAARAADAAARAAAYAAARAAADAADVYDTMLSAILRHGLELLAPKVI